MATRLEGLVLERIDLVDAPANPGARVVLMKRDTKKDAPGAGGVHVNRPVNERKRTVNLKRSPNVAKQSILKRLAAMIVKAADENDDEPQSKGAAYDALKSHHGQLGEALKAFGDMSKLAADHPAHTMKKMQDELGKAMEACDAAAQPNPDDEEDLGKSVDEPYGPQTGKGGVGKRFIAGLVAKQIEPIQKALDEANARVADAEKIAKAERDARELEGVKVDLRKFAHLPLDVDSKAGEYAVMKAASPAAYKTTLEALAAADAKAALSKKLEEELGVGGDGGSNSERASWAAIEQAAAKIVEKSAKPLSKQQAIAKVLEGKTTEHKELVQKYHAQTAGSARQ